MDSITQARVERLYPNVIELLRHSGRVERTYVPAIQELVEGEFQIASRWAAANGDKKAIQEVNEYVAQTFGIWDAERGRIIESAAPRLRGIRMDAIDAYKLRESYKTKEGSDLFAPEAAPLRNEFGNVVPGQFSSQPVTQRTFRQRVRKVKPSVQKPVHPLTLTIDKTKAPAPVFLNGTLTFVVKADDKTIAGLADTLREIQEHIADRLAKLPKSTSLADSFREAAQKSEDALLDYIGKALESHSETDILNGLRDAFHATTDEAVRAKLRDAVVAQSAEVGADPEEVLKKAVNE